MGSGHMPEELCQVSPKSHYVSLALHSDPSPLQIGMFNCLSPIFISFISNLYSPIFIFLAPAMLLVLEDLLPTPVLKINNHATGGWRTKDILGGPKAWSPKKKVANVEFYVIFEVFAFCGRRTKADFKDWGLVVHMAFKKTFFSSQM